MRIYISNTISCLPIKFKNLFCKDWKLSKNKSLEFQIYKCEDLIEVKFRFTTKEDHAGAELGFALFGLHISLNFYDHRHWDDENNCWENMSKTTKSMEESSKWAFMMGWCKKRGVNPTDGWNDAERAYNEALENKK